jgi:hypothetical protein
MGGLDLSQLYADRSGPALAAMLLAAAAAGDGPHVRSLLGLARSDLDPNATDEVYLISPIPKHQQNAIELCNWFVNVTRAAAASPR